MHLSHMVLSSRLRRCEPPDTAPLEQGYRMASSEVTLFFFLDRVDQGRADELCCRSSVGFPSLCGAESTPILDASGAEWN